MLVVFAFDTVEKQNIRNLSSKSYGSVVLNDSEVSFLWGGDSTYCPFFYCILFIDNIQHYQKKHIKFS